MNLDCAEPVAITTGIGFYDHMLEQIAKHGGFSLELECEGDLEVDDHHTIEDTAICLGDALRRALGNKLGIGRYGFVVPMDESEARASDRPVRPRPYPLFEGDFPRETGRGIRIRNGRAFLPNIVRLTWGGNSRRNSRAKYASHDRGVLQSGGPCIEGLHPAQ